MIGVVAIARNTFDVPLAETVHAAARASLDALGVETVGPPVLVYAPDDLATVTAAFAGQELTQLLVLQVTFADAGMLLALAENVAAPVLLWGFPEARWGGRPRLNSLCGINLAAHALGHAGRPYGYLYAAADDRQALAAALETPPLDPLGGVDIVEAEPVAAAAAEAALDRLDAARIGLFGEPPPGFETCRFEPLWLQRVLGIAVDRVSLADLFSAARAVPPEALAPVMARARAELLGLDSLEPAPVEGTLRLYAALQQRVEQAGLAGVAVRCWPETFTEMGCAVCGAMGMLSEDGVPAACEADVMGNVTSLLLQAIAETPPFLVDLVDVDAADDSAVFWHCGLAPRSMASPATPPRADIHANRKKPLLQSFALRPGRVTVARLSQARNTPQLVLAGGEMLERPLPYCGTAGVVRFDTHASTVLGRLMALGLEHHVSIVYGEHRPTLRAVAAKLQLPVVELC